MFFVASDGSHGKELWVSDGSLTGTGMVADICPGTMGSDPKGLTDVRGTLFFSADDGSRGKELWALPVFSYRVHLPVVVRNW